MGSVLVQDIAKKYLDVSFTPHQHPHLTQSPTTGFDCSGFVRFVLREAGYNLPPNLIHARDFFDNFGRFVPESEVKVGDLLFFSKLGKMPSHVAIYADYGRVIHSSRLTGTVGYSYIEELYVKFPRVIEEGKWNSNPIGYKTY